MDNSENRQESLPSESFVIDGFSICPRIRVTDAAKRFEAVLLTQPRKHPLGENIAEKIEMPLPQQILWLENTAQNYVLFQMSTAENQPAGQFVAYLHRSKRLPLFGHVIVPQLGTNFISHDAELAGYRALVQYVSNISWVTTLRIQALRLTQRDLLDFEFLARRAGLHLSDPISVTRTLVYDLASSEDELLSALDKKTRAKVRHASRDKVEIRALKEAADIGALQSALNASFARTQGTQGYLDFETYLTMAKKHPDRVLILGLYLKSRPTELMAYLINVRHDTHIEAVSAGSVSDPELRKLHFNYFLFWDRVVWAKEYSNTFLDLGGVTDGGPTDPLAGISAFKRHFSKKELEIGREMEIVLRPWKNILFKLLKKLLRRG